MKRVVVALCLAVSVSSFAQVIAPKEGALPSLAPLVESVKGAVVNVDVQKRMSDEQIGATERFMRHRGGHMSEEPLNSGTGSGFIIDPKGMVLTNNHVVEGAVIIRVRLDDGRSFDADIVGRDPLSDVAVIKLKGKLDQLPALKLGDSSSMRVGDWVVAIGNPFGLSSSVSAGIISALDRNIGASRYDQFLQTDAAINPGNSGGPLFNLRGEVIGINSAIIGSATGIGFAVPSSMVKALLPQLEKSGVVTRGFLGVGIQDVTPTLARALSVPGNDGALITSVTEGSPAQKGGLKEEDVVTSIDGEKVSSANGLTRAVALKRPDGVVTLSVVRAGKPIEAKVKLGVRPDLEGLGELEKHRGESSESGASTKQRIGLSFQDLDPRVSEASDLPRGGAQVVEVSPGSPAERAGFMRGMVVVEVNHKAIRGRDELMIALKEVKPGAVVLLKIAVPGGGANRSLLAVEMP
jgi:serine protease Do